MSMRPHISVIRMLAGFTPAVLAALTAFALLDHVEAGARGRAPWCGNLSGHGLDDCNYFSFEQCLQSVHGLGGICARNPAVRDPLLPLAASRKARHRDR